MAVSWCKKKGKYSFKNVATPLCTYTFRILLVCLFLHNLCSFFAGFPSLASSSTAATTTSGFSASSQSQTSSTLVVASSSRYVYDSVAFLVSLLYKKKLTRFVYYWSQDYIIIFLLIYDVLSSISRNYYFHYLKTLGWIWILFTFSSVWMLFWELGRPCIWAIIYYVFSVFKILKHLFSLFQRHFFVIVRKYMN